MSEEGYLTHEVVRRVAYALRALNEAGAEEYPDAIKLLDSGDVALIYRESGERDI